MIDGDEKLLRRYRDLPRDEPPIALDAAILAASRRAVASRPWSQRLAGPVSIAAVLVLAVGVSLNMQREQPGVEVDVSASQYPVTPSAAPDVATTAPQAPPVADTFRADTLARKVAPDPALAPAPKRQVADSTLKKDAATAPSGIAREQRFEPRAFSESPAAQASAATATQLPALRDQPRGPMEAADAQVEPPARAAMKQSALAAPREKRELANAAVPSGQASAAPALPDPVAELERIARLRTEGRHEEADKALDEFFRRHRDYRIPDPVWDRVRPR